MDNNEIKSLLDSCKLIVDEPIRPGSLFSRDSPIYQQRFGIHYSLLSSPSITNNKFPKPLFVDGDFAYFNKNKYISLDSSDTSYLDRHSDNNMLYIRSANFVLPEKMLLQHFRFIDSEKRQDRLLNHGKWVYNSLIFGIKKENDLYSVDYRGTFSARIGMLNSLDELKNVNL